MSSKSRGEFGYGSTVNEYRDNAVQPYRDDPSFGGGAGYRDRASTPQSGFNKLVDSISSQIFDINNSATTLDRVLRQLGTNKDSAELRNKIHETEKRTNSVITETADQFKRLSAISNKGDRAQRLQIDRLMAEFREVTQRYHSLQKKVADRVKVSAPVQSSSAASTGPDLIGWNEPVDDQRYLIEQRRKQAQMEKETNDVDVALLQERETQIRQLEGDILNINQIFQELGALIHEQGTVIDTIEANVESAHTDVEQGAQELGRAATYQSKARKKKCCIITILLVVVAVIVIIIVVSVTTKH